MAKFSTLVPSGWIAARMCCEQLLGGGLTDKGTMRGLEVKRKDADGKLQKIKDIEETVLLPDDIVYVKESWF
jgi:hypothetical protein